mgnify:CR=1 FL=1
MKGTPMGSTRKRQPHRTSEDATAVKAVPAGQRAHVSRTPIYTIGGTLGALGVGIFGSTLLWGFLSGEHTDVATAEETPTVTHTDDRNLGVVDLDELVDKLDERRETETVTVTSTPNAEAASDGESDASSAASAEPADNEASLADADASSHASPERASAPEGEIPDAGPVDTVPAPAASAAPAGVSANEHVIVWGDTLSELALYYGVDMASLARANGIRDVDMIYAGNTLVIPRG